MSINLDSSTHTIKLVSVYRCGQCRVLLEPLHVQISEIELAGRAWLSYKMGIPEENAICSKSLPWTGRWSAKHVVVKLSSPFFEIANRHIVTTGDQQQYIPRTWDRIIDRLTALNSEGLLPDLSLLAGLRHRGDTADPKLEDHGNSSVVVKQN